MVSSKRENFQAFLNHLSVQLGATVAVMQIYRAPAHRARGIEWPENIIPIFQPPHTPELNPIERLWQFLKGLWKQYFLVKGKRLMGLREENSKSLPKTIPLSPLTEKYWLWKGENFASLDALRQRVSQELEHLSAEQVQSLTSFDFIIDALLQAAF